MYAVDEDLAKSMQSLLDFEEGDGSIEDIFGVNFTASANPLISSFQSSAIIDEEFDKLDGTPRSMNNNKTKIINAANVCIIISIVLLIIITSVKTIIIEIC